MQKKTFLVILVLLSVLSIGIGFPARAGDQPASRDPAHDGDPGWGGREYDKPFHSHVRAGDLIGREVVNRRGEQLGSVDEIIIGLEGRVKYLVVSQGGVLGIGDKRVVVPFDAVDQMGGDEGGFLVDMSREEMALAPGFSEDEWPDFDDPDYEHRVRGYFGITPRDR